MQSEGTQKFVSKTQFQFHQIFLFIYSLPSHSQLSDFLLFLSFFSIRYSVLRHRGPVQFRRLLCVRFGDRLLSARHSIINVIQIIVAETCDSKARCQTNSRSQSRIAWNRTANNGPNQDRSKTEQSTAENAASKRNEKINCR